MVLQQCPRRGRALFAEECAGRLELWVGILINLAVNSWLSIGPIVVGAPASVHDYTYLLLSGA